MRKLKTDASVVVTMVLFLVGFASAPAWSQKKGTSVKVTQGLVVKKEWVQLPSEAGKGVLLGGAVGLATAQGKSKSKKWRNAVIGSAIGGAATAAREGNRRAAAYTVEAAPGQLIRVVSPTAIRITSFSSRSRCTPTRSTATGSARRFPSTSRSVWCV